jgi:hypothetical protein
MLDKHSITEPHPQLQYFFFLVLGSNVIFFIYTAKLLPESSLIQLFNQYLLRLFFVESAGVLRIISILGPHPYCKKFGQTDISKRNTVIWLETMIKGYEVRHRQAGPLPYQHTE